MEQYNNLNLDFIEDDNAIGQSSEEASPEPAFKPKLKQSRNQQAEQHLISYVGDPLEDFKANNIVKNVLEIKEKKKSDPVKQVGALQAAIMDQNDQIYDVQ